jgi:hypothetical protein
LHEKKRLLKRSRYPPLRNLMRFQGADVLSSEQDLPARQRQGPRYEIKYRRLARSIGPYQTMYLPLANTKV